MSQRSDGKAPVWAARPRERATKAERGAGSAAAAPRGGAALDDSEESPHAARIRQTGRALLRLRSPAQNGAHCASVVVAFDSQLGS